MELKLLEIIFIKSLAYFDNNSDGWQDRKEIFSEKKKVPYFRSQKSNLTKYMKGLVQKQVVEESWKKEEDRRRRIVEKRVYRLRQTIDNFDNLNKTLQKLSLEGTKSGKSSSLDTLYYTDYGKLMKSKFELEKRSKNTIIKAWQERLEELCKQRERINEAIAQAQKTINQWRPVSKD